MNTSKLRTWGLKTPMNGIFVGNELDRINANFDELLTDVNNLDSNLDAEIAARASADSAIQGEIDAHEANTSNPHGVTKSQVGLSSVTNNKQVINDSTNSIALKWSVDKPVMRVDLSEFELGTKGQIDAEVAARASADSAIQGEIDAHEANTSNPHGVTKSQVGLSSVTNNKQVINDSTNSIALKWSVDKPIMRVDVDEFELGTKGQIDDEISARANADSAIQGEIDAHEANTSNPHDVTKSQVGLANVVDALQVINQTGVAGLRLRVHTIPNLINSISLTLLTNYVAYAGFTAGNSAGIFVVRITTTSIALSDIDGGALNSDGTAKLYYWASA